MPDLVITPAEGMERRVHIDEHNLEEEVRKHPDHVYEISKYFAWLVSMRDEVKMKLKGAEAEADLNLRQLAEDNDKKMTEKAIESLRTRQPSVKIAKEELQKYERAVGAWGALKEAFEARGYALKSLIELYIHNYYGSDMERAGRNMNTAHADDARRSQAEGFRRHRSRE